MERPLIVGSLSDALRMLQRAEGWNRLDKGIHELGEGGLHRSKMAMTKTVV